MSAELKIEIETHHQVTRIPLESVRWASGQTYVALASPADADVDWHWKPIKLGVSDASFAEVVSGLEPGERVIAHCDGLPAPEPVTSAADTDEAIAMDERSPGR